MRGLIERLGFRLGEWTRKTLRGIFAEEIRAINCVLVQQALVEGTGEQLIRQNALVLRALEVFQQSHHALRDSEERHFRETLSAIDGVHLRSDDALKKINTAGESVDRLVELVTPKAERLQGRRPVVGGWDQVVAENLKEFEVPAK